MIEKKYFNYTFKGYYLRASYLNTFLVAVLVPIFLVTGLWQLNKAQEKQKILNHFDINATQPKLKLAEIPKPITPYFNYHTIEEEGHYDQGHQFLVESKRVKGKSGYEVITPFFVESSGKIILVDRGWVPLDSTDIPAINERTNITITGKTYMKLNQKKKEIEAINNNWPLIIPTIEIPTMGRKLNLQVEPFILLLNPGEKYGFVRDWQKISMIPNRHYAYAVKCFSFGIILCILFFGLNTRKLGK